MKSKPNKQKLIYFILIILLVIAISYIFVGKYTEAKQKEQLSIYQLGAEAGYEQAINQLMEQAETCQPFSVWSGNQTLNLIKVGCSG